MMGIVAPPSDPPVAMVLRREPLPGDRVVSIRRVLSTDTQELVALYNGLGRDDLYRRFFTAHAPPETFIENMTKVAERGGCGLVAVIEEREGVGRIVGEASYSLLDNGDGELGITVAEHARGWLGPYLLDALVEEAAARGVPNLEADVLVTNRPMLTILRARGHVIIGHDEQPGIVRVAIGTSHRVPSWPGTHDRPRLLLEVSGGRWRAEEAARAAGFQVVACPGPLRGWSNCPALRGEPCPLVAGADVIVEGLSDEPGRSLLDHHRRLHPSVPICVELPHLADDGGTGFSQIPQGARDTVVIGILQRLAAAIPSGPGDPPSNGPS